MFKETKHIIFLISILGAILYLPFLGQVHLFDWDEINFAESAREMIVSGNYLDVQINFEIFWEKPPLFIWLQVLSMKLFGINEFAARFPNAMVGILSLISIFLIGKNIKDTQFGLIWTGLYAASIMPFFYFKSGIIDPLFNLFIFLGIYFFYKFTEDVKKIVLYILLSATFIGLGILTKGPVALLIFGITAFFYMIIKKEYKKYINLKVLVYYVLILSFVGGFWFILQYLNGNKQILIDFVAYQIRLFATKDAGHGGFLLYHFVVILIGVFPASILALKGFKLVNDKAKSIQSFHLWMHILLWVVMILFTIVKTKIAHYSSMAYFPVTFLATYFIYYWLAGKKIFSKCLRISLVSIAAIWALIVVAVPLVGLNAKKIIESRLIHDPFANGNLQADVHWSGFEMLIGIAFLLLVTWSIFFSKNKQKTIIVLLSATLLFTYSVLLVIVPKVEGYSQRAAIDFYKEKAKESVYITTYGFKSYAHYFYSKEQLPKNKLYKDKKWLLSGNTDKTVYVVTKVQIADAFVKEFSNFAKLYEKNGFVFFKKLDIHDK